MVSPITRHDGYDLFWQIARAQLADEPLMRLDALINWPTIAARLAEIEAAQTARRGGPKGYAPMALTLSLLLGDWHALGFERLARALRLRLDFLLFAGLDPQGRTPTAAALCRHRQRLGDLYPAICAEIECQIDRAGYDLTPARGALAQIRLRART